MTRPYPMDRDELAEALSRCARPTLETALALALPTHELPLAAARLQGDSWCYRGERQAMGDEPLAALVALVERTADPSDSFLDPDDEAWEWVRAVSSGCGKVVVGFDSFIGGPALLADPAVPHQVIRDLAKQVHEGATLEVPFMVSSSEGPVMISGDSNAWRAVTGEAGGTPTAVPDVARRVRKVAESLLHIGIDVTDTLDLGDGEFLVVGTVDDAVSCEVPVTCESRLTRVGVDPRLVSSFDDVELDLPRGWSLAGTHAGDAVAVAPGGTWCYVRSRHH